MKKLENLSRRDLLKLLCASTAYGAAATPMAMLFESIVAGLVNKAYGATNEKKYLLCLLNGAPPRWTMDHLLTPYDTAAFTFNPSLATRYVASGGRYTSVRYETIVRTDFKGRNINVPYMWQFAVPKSGGGTRPMDELLKHLINIRGYNVGQSQHEAAQSLYMHPLGATQSLTAVAADNGSAFIPGVNATVGQYRFASGRGLTSVNIPNSGDMVMTLMAPFVSQSSSTFKTNKRSIASTIETATVALDNLAQGKDAKAAVISENRKLAQGLLENGIAGMSTYWSAAVARYKNLVDRSFMPPGSTNARVLLPGIDDLPIGITDIASRTANYKLTNVLCDQPDIRSMVTTGTRVARMAEHFALAEFVLTNEISNSVAISPDEMRAVYHANNVYGRTTFDEHDTGSMTSVFFNTLFNRALSACMLELIDRLKAKNVFQDTIIDVGSEFARSSRMDGTGSDHGYQGGTTALYVGAHNSGPMVIGNIAKDDNNSSGYGSHGTWGYAVRHTSLNETLHSGHVAATVAHLLNAPSPVTSARSLLKSGTNGFEPVFDELPIQAGTVGR